MTTCSLALGDERGFNPYHDCIERGMNASLDAYRLAIDLIARRLHARP